jgi:periplasmic protein TonB
MNASMDRGTLAAVSNLVSPGRHIGSRLACAAVLSIVVHAALLYKPATTSPPGSHPVMALIVRTIAATTDAALPTSSLRASPAEISSADARPPSIGPTEPRGHARPLDATTPKDRAPLVPRVSPERAPAPSHRSGTADSGSRGEAVPPRAQGPVYHMAGELDPPPRPLHDIEPAYPPEAGFQPGIVVLRLYIDESGSVERVDVLQATPPGLFENAARTAFAEAHFSPGRIAGMAVKCQLTIEVEFTPINRGGAVSGRTY